MRGARSSASTSALVFAVVLFVYLVNGREIGAPDTFANRLLPIAVLRGDGLVLNRFADAVRGQYYVKDDGEDLISRYPVLPALLALPVTAVHVYALDRLSPQWSHGPEFLASIRTMAKNSAAIVAALTAVCLYHLLLRLQLEAVALPTTLATAFGSSLWVVASQSPWQHGSTALFLTLSLLLLVPTPAARWRLAAGGVAIAAAVCARLTTVVFAVPLALWMLHSLGRRALWFLVPAAAVALLLLIHHWTTFGNLMGGVAEIEALGHVQHGVSGSITDEPLVAFAGTLASPSRGLLVFSPWVLLVLALLPATRRHIAAFPTLCAVLLGLIPFCLLLSAYGVWWAGESFGPRYWTEAMPLFGVMLGFTLAWARRASRPALLALRGAIALAIAIQAVGAFCYPSSWNKIPVSVDLRHERLWDWRDTEITRCLEEGPFWPTRVGGHWRLVRRGLAG